MRVQANETPASVVAFAPKKAAADATMAADDAGQHIVALLQKASDVAKAECQRAMDLAHRVSSQLREAEDHASLRPKRIIFGTVRLVRKNGSSALKVSSSRRSFKRSDTSS